MFGEEGVIAGLVFVGLTVGLAAGFAIVNLGCVSAKSVEAACRNTCGDIDGGGAMVDWSEGLCLCAPRESMVFVEAGCVR